jgi:hypothetical protein
MSESVPNVDVNVLTGGDQPLAPAPVSRLGRWISRIVRGSLVVAVLGSAVAYGALQAKPELANYVWFIEDDAPVCNKAYREMGSCSLSAGGCCSQSASVAESGCCASKAVAAVLALGSEEPTCPHACPSAKAESTELAAAETTVDQTTDAVTAEIVTTEGDAAVAVDAEPVTVEVTPETPAE